MPGLSMWLQRWQISPLSKVVFSFCELSVQQHSNTVKILFLNSLLLKVLADYTDVCLIDYLSGQALYIKTLNPLVHAKYADSSLGQ